MESVVDRFEACLLAKADEWIPLTAQRLAWLLKIKRIKDDFLGWLRRARSSHGDQPSQLTEAVERWLNARQRSIRSRAKAVTWLEERLSNGQALQDGDLQSFVVLGLQTVLWTYLPATHEFRACLVRSNLLPRPVLETLRQSFRVPHKRGALNWMTDFFIQSAKASGQEPSPVVLHDAALDLRGRVAAEDLILGDRSVIGFPIFSRDPEGIRSPEDIDACLVGYLFFGYPAPGLFDGFSPDERSLLKAVADVRRELVKDLAHALDIQLVEDFAISIREGPPHGSQGPRRRPLIALASHDPAGSLAYMLLEREGSNTEPRSCEINETAFMERVWDLYRLAEIFPSGWADPVVRHMQSYAGLVEQITPPASPAPLAWLPRHQSHDHNALQEVQSYYPETILGGLNLLIPGSSHTGQSWFDWHLNNYLKGAPVAANNVIQRGLEQALSLYHSSSGSHNHPHADLVVPITYIKDNSARVVGFLRFSCHSKFTPFGETIWEPNDRIPRFCKLFQVVAQKKSELDGSLGQLIWLLSEHLQQSVCGTRASVEVPAVQKEAFEALRLLCERITSYCTSALSDDSPTRLDLGIVRQAFAHLPFSWTGHNELLQATEQSVRALGDALAKERPHLPLVTVVSLWPRVWHPVIKTVSPQSGSELLAELFTRDPGLPQLLTHLVSTPAWRKEGVFEAFDGSLSQRWRLVCDLETDPPSYSPEKVQEGPTSGPTVGSTGCKHNRIVLDLGLPARTSNLGYLNVKGKGNRMALSWNHGQDQCKRQVELEWDLDSESILLGGASYVPGAVSLRVEAGLELHASVTVQTNALETCEPGSLRSLLGDADRLLERIDVLEQILGDPSSLEWRPAELDFGKAWLLALFDGSIERPVVNSFRNLALASATGQYRGRVLDETLANLEAYKRQQGSIGHGYGTAVKMAKDSLSRIIHQVKTNNLTQESFCVILTHLQERLDAIELLANAAIAYARNVSTPLEKRLCTAEKVKENVEKVLRAFRSFDDRLLGAVAVEVAQQLDSIQVSLVEDLFIHGFARLVENAVRAATGVKNRQRAVGVTLRLADNYLEVAIANSADVVDLDYLSASLEATGTACPPARGQLTWRGLGLLEACDCFKQQGITRVVERGVCPYDVLIRLLIPLRPT